MKLVKRICFNGVAMSALLFSVCTAYAQFRTSVQGTVTDPSGSVIAGAKLELKDDSTNQLIIRTSNAAGVFNFDALASDPFTLTVVAPSFARKVIKNIRFIPEQANSLNIRMGIGDVSQTVTVNANSVPAMDTQTSNIGTTITSSEIKNMPSFNRDIFTLSQLAPGAISDGAQAAGGGVSTNPGNQGPGGSGAGGQAPTENGPQINANGEQYQNNSISIDGISTVSAVWGGTTIITPAEDSVSSVRIVTNSYDAEDGRFAGAQTLVSSMTGTNQLHGSAFIAIHRPGLNATQRTLRYSNNNVADAAEGSPANNPIKDMERFNQYGGALGGPFWKNKVFAFFAYESSPNDSTSVGYGWYETPQFRSLADQGPIAKIYNNFPGAAVRGTIVNGTTATCAAVGLKEGINCNTIAGQGLNIGSPLHTGIGMQDLTTDGTSSNPGVGGGLNGVPDVALYKVESPYTSYYRQYNGRLDANITSKDHLAYAIYYVPQGHNDSGTREYQRFNQTQINEAMSGIWNHTFSPTFLNEARANAAGWRWNQISSNPQMPYGLPTDSISLFGSNGTTIGQFGPIVGTILNQWTFTFKDVATKILGRHSIKFGGEETRLHYLQNPVGVPSYSFYNIWDFLNDAPASESGGFNPKTGIPGGSRSDQRENILGLFVQDSYKARPNITINAGMRYSYFGSLYDKQNKLQHAELGYGSASFTGLQVQQGGSVWKPQKLNFGPQFGFNWSPESFNSKLVIRGGYGINYNQEEIAITANTSYNPPAMEYVSFSRISPQVAGVNGAKIIYATSSAPSSLYGYPSNPNTITSYNSSSLPIAGSANITIIGDGHGHLSTSYVQHYSLGADYEQSRELVFSLGYQGSLGRHLIGQSNPNALAVAAGDGLNPLVTGGSWYNNIGSSNNNALLISAKHQMLHGFMASAQFMWAKSMDTEGSGPYSEDPYYPLGSEYSYGRSDYNIGKSFKVYGMWQPVLWHGNRWPEKIFGGWSLSGIFNWHTGYPYTPNYGISQSIYCQYCGYSTLRPFYNGEGGHSHGNKAFINGTNFIGMNASSSSQKTSINGSGGTVVAYTNEYFNVPSFQNAITWANSSGFPSANKSMPSPPGLARNSFTGPSYRDLDASFSKSFGLPNNRILGENGSVEIRANAFNLFNIANLSGSGVVSSISSNNFGQDTSELGGRTITLQASFNF